MIWNNLYLMHDIDDIVIQRAIADAFDVPSSRVLVVPLGQPDAIVAWNHPGTFAVAMRGDSRQSSRPGTDYPVEITIASPGTIPAGNDLRRLGAIGHALNVPFMASIDSDDQDTMRLVFPNGDVLPRDLNDEGDLVYQPGDRERLAPFRARLAHAG